MNHLATLRRFLLCSLQPFFYGAATRVPLVFIGAFAREFYDATWWQVGLMIMTYQCARALINYVIPLLGIVVGHFFGVLCGIAGYVFLLCKWDTLEYFWIGMSLVGLSEIITCMQHYVKEEYCPLGLVKLRQTLRLQYAYNVAGTAIGFILSAVLYQVYSNDTHVNGKLVVYEYGVPKVAIFGIVLESCELLSLVLYLYIMQRHPETSPEAIKTAKNQIDVDKEVLGTIYPSRKISLRQINTLDTRRSIEKLDVHDDYVLIRDASAFAAAMSIDLLPHFTREEIETAYTGKTADLSVDDQEKESEAKPSWISYFIVVTFAVQALMIGVVLSTSPILLYEHYKHDFIIVGVVFGVGETIGAVLLFLLVPAANQARVRKYFKGPFNLLITVSVLGAFALLYPIQSIGVAIFITIVIMSLNDFATSLAAEMQGGTVRLEHYARINMLGNFARRIGNMVTAALGPIMYGVAYYLPFVVFGCATVLWMIILSIAFHIRGNQMVKEEAGDHGHRSGGLRYYFDTSFITAEAAAQGGRAVSKAAAV